MDDDTIPHYASKAAPPGGHTHELTVEAQEPHTAQVAVWVFGAIVLALVAVILTAGVTWAVIGLASGQIDLPVR